MELLITILIALLAVFLGDGLNIYMFLMSWIFAEWFAGYESMVILIPAAMFGIAGAIAGNGKRSGELEKRKLSFKK